MNIKITADSTCDLSEELVKKYDIEILPLYIVKDGKSYKDGVEITPSDIFEHVKAGGALTSTAAVNVADYIDAFTPLSKEYDAVIHIDISADFQAAIRMPALRQKILTMFISSTAVIFPQAAVWSCFVRQKWRRQAKTLRIL